MGSFALAKQVADDVGGFSVAGFEEVGIDVQRRGCVRVSEPPAHCSHRNACSEELRGVEVSEVVESYALQAELLADPTE